MSQSSSVTVSSVFVCPRVLDCFISQGKIHVPPRLIISTVSYSWLHFHPRLSGCGSEVYTHPIILMKRHVLFIEYSDLLDR